MGRALDFDWLSRPETEEGRAVVAGTLRPTGAYVRPAGTWQKLASVDIERLYTGLEERLAARTLHFLHCTCLPRCSGAVAPAGPQPNLGYGGDTLTRCWGVWEGP